MITESKISDLVEPESDFEINKLFSSLTLKLRIRKDPNANLILKLGFDQIRVLISDSVDH